MTLPDYLALLIACLAFWGASELVWRVWGMMERRRNARRW